VTTNITLPSYGTALELLLQTCAVSAPEQVVLRLAAGRVLAMPAAALLNVPAFDNAAMDGYALRAADTVGASSAMPVNLAIAGSLAAGAAPAAGTSRGQAWEIMTGAVLPAGCDAVVPRERVEVRSGTATGHVAINQPAPVGANVRRTGEDYRVGDGIVIPGTWLDSRHIMALAACGHDEVIVRRRPRVAILVTGSELATGGLPGRAATIRDSNGPGLSAALEELGAEVSECCHAPDDLSALTLALQRLQQANDLVISTGGVSAGRLDLVPAAAVAAGATLIFHKVAIRPGKPLLVARSPTGSVLVGLPGNPVAVAVGLRFFVAQAVRAMLGQAPETTVTGTLRTPFSGRGDVDFFAKARVSLADQGSLQAEILPGQESFRIAPLVAANAWAMVPRGCTALNAGDSVRLFSVSPRGVWESPGS
jgi:molybdopterin molybdotransferase